MSPTPENQKQTTQLGPRYDLPSALKQLEKCGFECEAGPLELNTAFLYLKSISTGPRYLIGQKVWVDLHASFGCIDLHAWHTFIVTACGPATSADDDGHVPWVYSLVHNPGQFNATRIDKIVESRLYLEKGTD